MSNGRRVLFSEFFSVSVRSEYMVSNCAAMSLWGVSQCPIQQKYKYFDNTFQGSRHQTHDTRMKWTKGYRNTTESPKTICMNEVEWRWRASKHARHTTRYWKLNSSNYKIKKQTARANKHQKSANKLSANPCVSPFASTSELFTISSGSKEYSYKLLLCVMCVGCDVLASQCAETMCSWSNRCRCICQHRLANGHSWGEQERKICRQPATRTTARLNNAFSVCRIDRLTGRFPCKQRPRSLVNAMHTCTRMARPRNSSQFSKTNTLILSTIPNHQQPNENVMRKQ